MLTQNKVDDAIIGIVKIELNRVIPRAFKRLPKYKFTREDRMIMVDMLELKKRCRPAEQTNTLMQAALLALAQKADSERSKGQHESAIQRHIDAAPENQNYDLHERKTVIDASEFDNEDFAVLELMNKIIAGINRQRKVSTKKSINPTRKEIA